MRKELVAFQIASAGDKERIPSVVSCSRYAKDWKYVQ